MSQLIVDHIFSTESNIAIELTTGEMKRALSFGSDWNEMVIAALIGLDGSSTDPIGFPDLPFTGMGLAAMNGTTKGMFQPDPAHIYYTIHGINSSSAYAAGGGGIPPTHSIPGGRVGRRVTSGGAMVDDYAMTSTGTFVKLLTGAGQSQGLAMYLNKTTQEIRALRPYPNANMGDYSLAPSLFWSGLECLNWTVLEQIWESAGQIYTPGTYDLSAATPDLSFDEVTYGGLDSVSVWWVPLARKMRVLEVGVAKWS